MARYATKSAIATLVNDLDLRELLDNLLDRIEALEDSEAFVRHEDLRAKVEEIIDDKRTADFIEDEERKMATEGPCGEASADGRYTCYLPVGHEGSHKAYCGAEYAA